MSVPRENLRVVGGLADDPAHRNNGSTEDAAVSAGGVETNQTGAPRTDATAPAEAPPGELLVQSEAAPLEVPAPKAAVPVGTEIELKLLVDPEQLAHFNEAQIIAANARGNGTRKHLKSVYYDTPGRALWENGLSLRVRQSGTRFAQTVKAEASDDPLRRGEWEASVPSMAPDLALAAPFMPAKLRDDLQLQPVEAVFTSDIHRHQRLVDLPSGTVEVAFDHGVLKAGVRSTPVAEIELELKAGHASAIYELALRLAEHGAVRPSIRTKSARGFDLAADAAPTAEKPRKLRVEPAASLDDTFAAILRECLRHLLQSLPAAEHGGDPEGVHQLRVALRRLRSAFNLLRAAGASSRLEGFREEAGWLAQNLSTARDLDVFQGSTLPVIAEACSGIVGFDVLSTATEQRRGDAYRKVREVLAGRRCAAFVLGLGSFIETRGWRSDVAPEALGQLAEPAANFARRVLAIQHLKVLKRGRHLKSLGAEQRHRLRLAVKKLRYLADFLLPLCAEGKAAKRFAHRLADLQEELGAFNDMATTAKVLESLGAETAGGGTAAAAITGWQAHGMVGAEPRLRGAWKEFAEVKPPWVVEAPAQ
ncbi:MAG: CHAD domain-containing protein [Bradyrhizobium sp.]|uniref:CYTH and CHAD domain-containing protein n=1 Tax=Bradyrhizobium sp. TaxID=376 RepID=UPI001DB00296|nr:CYTH and CHAD domain-containing protein [Bradyrhizobium sp.]MBV9559851.1 CHAD domain-containing protein [Bradyrhizobium sp.]